MCVLVAQPFTTLCESMDCHPPKSSVNGILQARILAWVAIPFSRGSSQPRDQTWVSCIAGKFFTIWAYKWEDSVLPSWVNILYVVPMKTSIFSELYIGSEFYMKNQKARKKQVTSREEKKYWNFTLRYIKIL